MTRKQKQIEKLPFRVKLPANAKSPTNSIYKRYDIIAQENVLNSYDGDNTVYSTGPFVLQFQTGKTKRSIKTVQANDVRDTERLRDGSLGNVTGESL